MEETTTTPTAEVKTSYAEAVLMTKPEITEKTAKKAKLIMSAITNPTTTNTNSTVEPRPRIFLQESRKPENRPIVKIIIIKGIQGVPESDFANIVKDFGTPVYDKDTGNILDIRIKSGDHHGVFYENASFQLRFHDTNTFNNFMQSNRHVINYTYFDKDAGKTYEAVSHIEIYKPKNK